MSTYTKVVGVSSHAPSMNIRDILLRRDPIKQLFEKAFEVLPKGARGHVVATIGEFIGTLLFVFLAFSGVEVAAASSNRNQGDNVSTTTPIKTPQQLLYIALSVGFSLVVTAWTFFRISGGLFNPAISLGMALIGAISWFRCVLLCIAQTVATIIASYIVANLYNGGLNVSVGLGGGISNGQAVVIEMLLTAQLAFTIFMLAAEQHEATHLAPVGIGLSLFIAELIGVFWTGGAVNPARALGPCIVTRSFPENHWIWWVGPTAGVIVAVLFFKLVKALEYENAEARDNSIIELQVLPQTDRKPSSVIPLTSVHTPSAHSVQPTNKKQIQPIKAPLSTPAIDNGKDDEHVASSTGLNLPLVFPVSRQPTVVVDPEKALALSLDVTPSQSLQRQTDGSTDGRDEPVELWENEVLDWAYELVYLITLPVAILLDFLHQEIKNARSGRYGY